jgi:serine/threonine protein kinase
MTHPLDIQQMLRDLQDEAPGERAVADPEIDQLRAAHPELDQELKKLRLIVQAELCAEQRPMAGPSRPESPAPPLAVPAAPLLPDYELIRLISQGGFGQVWLGRNRCTRRFHAVKLIPRSRDAERDGIRAYQQRVLGHPHLVPIEHVGDSGQYLYYTMPLADDANGASGVCDPETYEALTLLRHGQRQGPLPVTEVLAIATALAKALEHLHAAGLLHKDVKPANVLRVRGAWQLGDMGLMTDVGKVDVDRGTRAFWPPEGPRDRTADLYALGKTLVLVWTGAALEQFPDFLRGGFPRGDRDARAGALRQILLRACHDEPAQRYPTVRAMLQDLNRVRSRRIAGWWALAGAVAVLLAAICLPRLVRPNQDQVPQGRNTPAANLSGELTVWAEDPADAGSGWRKIDEPGVLPVRQGHRVRVRATVTQPAHIYLVWLDSQGQVFPLYPWNDDKLVRSLADPPSPRPPQTEVHSPSTATKGWLLDDHAGLETILLLVRREPLAEGISWTDAIGTLGPTPSGHPREIGIRGFDPGRPVDLLNEGQFRGIEVEARERDQELLQLMSRLRRYFEMVRAVRFAHEAG